MSSANLPEPWEARLAALADDRQRGASALATEAANLLATLAEQGTADTFRPMLGRVTARLARAQPSIAPILHVINAALLAADGPEGRAAVPPAMHALQERLARAGEGYGALVAERVGLRGTVVTLSHSALVARALHDAAALGCRWRIVVARSAPGGEGSTLAQALAATAHESWLVPDSGAANHLRDATVLLGADALSSRGLINKVGSMGMAGLAHFLQRPVIVLAHTLKLVPEPLEPLVALDPHAGQTLLSPAPRGVHQDAHLFDVTPLAWLSLVVTELGALELPALRAHLGAWTVHPSLLEEAKRRSPAQ